MKTINKIRLFYLGMFAANSGIFIAIRSNVISVFFMAVSIGSLIVLLLALTKPHLFRIK